MNLGSALGLPADVFRYKADPRLVLPNCLIGVEFEFEGVKGERITDRHSAQKLACKEPWAQYWRVKHDGSLHDNGAEYLFERPLFGEDAIEAVTQMLKYAREHEFKVNIRTGGHVHVDVRDLSRVQLAVHNVLYALFEKAVYRLAGNNREENVFCLPWYKADAMSTHVNNINSDHHNIRHAAEALGDEKYGGLNLDSLARFGSVEFRHALSTTDADWFIKWINVCLSFKRAAMKLNAQPLEVIHNLSGVGPDNLARLVFEDLYDTIWYPELADDVWNTGVETALMIYPRQNGPMDVASLSWNRVKPREDQPINRGFKAFIERSKKLYEAPNAVDQGPNILRPADPDLIIVDDVEEEQEEEDFDDEDEV